MTDKELQTLLPQALDAEQGLICSFIIAPDEIGPICAGSGVTEADFHHPCHSIIFQRLNAMWIAAQPIDMLTLTQRLRDNGELEDCGGISFVTSIATALPTASMAEGYIEIIKEKACLRALYVACKDFEMRSLNTKANPQELIELASSRICSIGSAGAKAAKPKTPKEIALEAQERAQDRQDKRGLPNNVIRTGLEGLDAAMSGIRPGDYVLVSGKEKSGKTTLAFNIFEHVVFQQQKRSIVVSLEMKIPEITDRLISQMGKINLTNILNGWMNTGEMDSFCATTVRIADGKFQFRDDIFSLGQIVGAIRQYKAQNPDLEFAIVDYLQLIDGEKTKEDKREAAIAHISRTLRRLAGELNLAMIVLVQLNEDGQVRESRSPGMDCTAHIRIEPGDEEGLKWARVVYQRNGPSNVGIPLTHIGHLLRFSPSTRDPSQETKTKPAARQKRNWNDR